MHQCYRVIILILMTLFIGAWTPWDLVTYFGTTDKPIGLKWDASEGAEFYRITAKHVEHGTERTVVETEELSITTKLPRSGHTIFTIYACAKAADGTELCSEPSASTDPEVAVVDGNPRGWWVYGHVAPPSDLDIQRGP